MGVVLCINSGSSSLKFSAVRFSNFGSASGAGSEEKIFEGAVENIGTAQARIRVQQKARPDWEQTRTFADIAAALEALLSWLQQSALPPPDAIGHRLVHGGPNYFLPQRVRPQLLASLREVIPFAPLHLPAELSAIEIMSDRLPDTPQGVCFDTAFHRNLPAVAQRFALPRAVYESGVKRYGFHGLSYEYLVQHLGAKALGKAVLAHLGNGSSMAAVDNGICLDTTMGLSPTGGLMMGTRSGDLDPGVLIYLLRTGKNLNALEHLVNREAGLLGVSGISADMQVLIESEASDPNAKLAVEMFCYQAAKAVASLAVSLGGLETLVFTGGIGEHASAVRELICQRLGFLGLKLDSQRNVAGDDLVNTKDSRVAVKVVRTDEDLMIARHVNQLLFTA